MDSCNGNGVSSCPDEFVVMVLCMEGKLYVCVILRDLHILVEGCF